MQQVLAEKDAEEFLEKEGFNVAKRAIIKNSEEIKEVEQKISYPWAMKAASQKIIHKAKLGGVILNIDSQIKAQNAFEKLSQIEYFEEAIVQEMVSGEEIIIGLKKTPEFGQTLMLGRGGSKVEEEKDVSFRILPINLKDIEELMKEVHFLKNSEEKQINLKAIKRAIMETNKLAKKYPNLIELDMNPVFINPEGAKIADARIILES